MTTRRIEDTAPWSRVAALAARPTTGQFLPSAEPLSWIAAHIGTQSRTARRRADLQCRSPAARHLPRREPERHDIAVLHHVVAALHPRQRLLTRRRVAA